MPEEEINLEESFLETIKKADIKSEIIELADASIGKLESMHGVLEEIPYIKSLYAFGKVGMALRDRHLIKKLLHFLRELNTISEEERMRMFWDLEDNPKEKIKVGEHIITLIDKAESTEKADFIGRLFKKYTLMKIDSSQFIRMTMIVNNSILSDLKQLPRFKEELGGLYFASGLHSFGLLVKTGSFDNTGNDVEQDKYMLSAIGKNLISLLELETT
jgi:hypothetical protein